MININISGEVNCTFQEFKEKYGNHKVLARFSDEKKETWLKVQYAKLYKKLEETEKKETKKARV
jgi:hypothetical protein